MDGHARHNHDLMRKVIEHVLLEPAAYDQSIAAVTDSRNICGVSACLAGSAAIIDGRVTLVELLDCIHPKEILARAQIAFGFTDEEAEIVFTGDPVTGWPEEFGNRWMETDTLDNGAATQQQAFIAADYLTWIIEHGYVR